MDLRFSDGLDSDLCWDHSFFDPVDLTIFVSTMTIEDRVREIMEFMIDRSFYPVSERALRDLLTYHFNQAIDEHTFELQWIVRETQGILKSAKKDFEIAHSLMNELKERS